jgi:hypothetical protein
MGSDILNMMGYFRIAEGCDPRRTCGESMCIVFAVMSSAHFLHSLYSCPSHDHQDFHLGSLLVHVPFLTCLGVKYRLWKVIFLLSLEIFSICYCYLNSPTAPNSLLFPLIVILPVTQFSFIVGKKIYL